MTPRHYRTYLERDPQHSRHLWVLLTLAVLVLAAALSVAGAHLSGLP